tara:strand:+ start:1781 stop:2545 length:765 start_codon:yes stop_codon:yes gene_type:complete
MEIKPPNGISPMKLDLIKKYFKRWKKNRYRNNPLDMILYENHIFIDEINEIPRRFCGECKLYDKSGKLKYDGGYMYGRFHGYGKLIINANEYYEGEFVKGEYDGKGTYHWKKMKIKFSGEWKYSVRCGKGKQYENNQVIFSGMWRDNIKNGICKEYYKNRLIFDGIFKDDKRNGYGKEFNEYGEIINEGIWKDDKFMKGVSDDELCIICFENKREIAFLPCGHFCICKKCSEKYEDNKCLVCREKFRKTQQIFM